MSLTVRKHKKSGSTRGSSTGVTQLHQDLKQLIELQKAQEIRFVAETPDVPRLRFAENQLVNVELSYRTNFSTSTTGPTYGQLAFALSSAANYTSYTACFDQYRIIQVNVKFLPIGTSALVAGTQMLTVLDYDDATAATSENTYYAYKNLKITPFGQIEERTLVPRIAVAAFQGTVFSAYANMPSNTFIDSASPTAQYYGVKYFVGTTSAATTVNVIVTLMVQFRAQRAG